MAEQQAKEGGAAQQVNLQKYHAAKQELYHQLTNEERRAFEEKADETNEASKALPETSRIFE